MVGQHAVPACCFCLAASGVGDQNSRRSQSNCSSHNFLSGMGSEMVSVGLRLFNVDGRHPPVDKHSDPMSHQACDTERARPARRVTGATACCTTLDWFEHEFIHPDVQLPGCGRVRRFQRLRRGWLLCSVPLGDQGSSLLVADGGHGHHPTVGPALQDKLI